jgi:hypothetical protein
MTRPCPHCGVRHRWPRCVDCHIALMPGTPPGRHDWQRYMVRDEVWAAAGMHPRGGWLCIPCLETRLDRPLVGRDLAPGLLVNTPGRDDDTDWLAALKLVAVLDSPNPGLLIVSGECSCPTCRRAKP